ncbi:MAG: flagellar hook-associated protein FlgL [Halanaerobiales bacterium]
MSRITNNMIINNFLANFTRSQKSLNKYMEQLTTGEKFSRISDEPIYAVKAMKLETILQFNEKYIENAEEGINWLNVTDKALDDVVKTLRKLRDSAVRAANGSLTPDDRQKIQQEVLQLKEHLIDVANSRYGNAYIFNGTETKLQPYVNAASIYPDDYLANGSVSDGKLTREVGAGIIIDINVTGAEIGFAQIFADLQAFSNALEDDDTETLQTMMGTIDKRIESVLGARAQVGSRQNRLELTVDRFESQEIAYADILNNTKGVDIAETIMKLKNEENVYRIALATGARIIQPTLMDFLR